MRKTCLIVEDQQYAADIIRDYINKDPRLELLDVVLDARQALDGILNGPLRADITFLDVQMPEISGIQLAAQIKELTAVIFTTAHSEHGAEAFKVDAIDYLLKPIDHEHFKKSIEKALKWLNAKQNYISIPGYGKGQHISIQIHDILFIQSAQHYVTIHTIRRKYMMHIAMKDVVKRFGENYFFRVHKSFVVNLAHVIKVSNDIIHLSFERIVSLGPNYREAFMERWKR